MTLEEYLKEAEFIKNKPLKRSDAEIPPINRDDYEDNADKELDEREIEEWLKKYNIELQEFEEKTKANYEKFLKNAGLFNGPEKHWPLQKELANLYKAISDLRNKNKFDKAKQRIGQEIFNKKSANWARSIARITSYRLNKNKKNKEYKG